MHKHLRRLPQIYSAAPLFFITTCTWQRAPLLTQRGIPEILTSSWQTALDLHGWAVGAYVVMPDHVHFFCRNAADGKTLSQFMQRWKQWTGRRIREALHAPERVWQREFFDHVLRSEERYREKADYVWHNPERAGLVPPGGEWPHRGHVHF